MRESRNTRGMPLLFHDKCPGFFYVHYTTHGTYSFTSHPKDEAIMVKCLAQGHESRDCGLTGIRTHILTTPELESNALDRSATTLHKGKARPKKQSLRKVCLYKKITKHTLRQQSKQTHWGSFANITNVVSFPLKGHYRHDQSTLSTGHGIGVLV